MTSLTDNLNKTNQKLILASQSPRRRELLSQLGFEFSIQASDIDETVLSDEKPYDYVLRLAKEKAQHVFASLSQQAQESSYVLGSDTSVVFNNTILGKPENKTDCMQTLSLLSGNQHQVLTAIALASRNGVVGEVVTTNVTFKILSEAEIQAYWLTGEPQDKAGSYGIQGVAGQFVKSISGSYSAVVGLPLFETAQRLNAAGFTGALHANKLCSKDNL